MSAPASPPAAAAHRRFGRGAAGWIAVLALCLGFIAWDTVETYRHLARLSAAPGVAVRAPTVDPASPTGWTDGRRQVVYPGRSLDGTHWVMQTQQMFATGEWRLRHVDDDNAPAGREQHWGSPYRWWLATCGWIDHLLTGQPLGLATERAALFSNPALLALLLIILVPWAARHFGTFPAIVLALTLTGTVPLTTLFAPDNPDHHGLIQLGATLGVFALLAGGGGWVRRETAAPDAVTALLPNTAQARHAFLFSAFCIGGAMWVSAVTLIPILAGIGLGALWAAWAGRNAPASLEYQPALWRRWGQLGGLITLGAYLLEYFPSHLRWRLEVNHPVYALAWFAAGEVLAQLTAALSRGKILPERATWKRLAPALLAVLLPAGVLLIGGPRVFSAGDGFFWALIHDYVPECQGLVSAWQRAGLNFSTVAQSLPMFALPVIAIWLGLRSTPAPVRALAAIPCAVTTVIWLLSLRELRWWNVGFGFLPLVLLPLFVRSKKSSLAPRSLRWAVLLLIVPGFGEAIRQTTQRSAVTTDDIQGLAERDLAHALRLRTGAQPLVVLSSPATTSRLLYFAGARGLGTTYWENLAGLKTAAAIYAAPTANQARELLRAAGVTHLVFLSWDDFAASYVRLARGLPRTAAITEPAFALDLLDAAEPPAWLRELPHPLPDHPTLRSERVRIFEVTDRTNPAQVLVRRVNRLLDQPDLPRAQALRPALEKFPADLAAQIALARLSALANDDTGYTAAMERIEGLHGQDATLEPDAHVDLATLFLLSDLTDEARARLTVTLRLLDDPALRRLSSAARAHLLTLTQQLAVAWPDPHLHELARQLGAPASEK